MGVYCLKAFNIPLSVFLNHFNTFLVNKYVIIKSTDSHLSTFYIGKRIVRLVLYSFKINIFFRKFFNFSFIYSRIFIYCIMIAMIVTFSSIFYFFFVTKTKKNSFKKYNYISIHFSENHIHTSSFNSNIIIFRARKFDNQIYDITGCLYFRYCFR